MKINCFGFLFVLYFLSCFAYASWPLFLMPDKQFLLNQHYIDTTHCPIGMGRVINKQTINILPLCKTRCPTAWSFVTSSDETCHRLSVDFNLQNSDITHYRDNEGTTLYSVISLSYGETNLNNASFNLIFTTPAENWFCIEADPETHTLTCANDT